MVSLSTEDIVLHLAKFGIDIYPAIEIAKDRTRLNIFYEEASSRFPELYEQLVASDTEFRISKQFAGSGRGPQRASLETFVLTQRGPVFVFPFQLLGLEREIVLEDVFIDRFQAVRRLFGEAFPDRKEMRLGLVREVMFSTGSTNCKEILTRESEFAGAELHDGINQLNYKDDQCNVRIKIEPRELSKTSRVAGETITESAGHVLIVTLDVNNSETRPLSDADVEGVIERATSLWPDELLKYLNGKIERDAS